MRISRSVSLIQALSSSTMQKCGRKWKGSRSQRFLLSSSSLSFFGGLEFGFWSLGHPNTSTPPSFLCVHFFSCKMDTLKGVWSGIFGPSPRLHTAEQDFMPLAVLF